LLKQIGPAELREFRNSWNNSAATTTRKHERMRSLFAFCVSNGWLAKSPMDAFKKPVVYRGWLQSAVLNLPVGVLRTTAFFPERNVAQSGSGVFY